jgi:carbonic anhydrase/acetyltransferase-like protein (isoleucine patch superfamily)
MAIYQLGDLVPTIHPEAYVHPQAVVIGDVTIGARSSIWPMAVVRGDHGSIVIGEETSIQDGCIVHTVELSPTQVGSRCVVGHLAHLEGCIIEDDALIGAGSIVMQTARVCSWGVVGAGALVPGGMVVPAGQQALGVPAKLREGSDQRLAIIGGSQHYATMSSYYPSAMKRLD